MLRSRVARYTERSEALHMKKEYYYYIRDYVYESDYKGAPRVTVCLIAEDTNVLARR